MHTLSPATPANHRSHFASREEYLAFQHAWKRATNDPVIKKQLRAEHYLLRALLFGREPAAAFTPITNPRKLKGGRWPGDTLHKTRARLDSVAWDFGHARQRGDPLLLEKAERRLAHFAGPLSGALPPDLFLRIAPIEHKEAVS